VNEVTAPSAQQVRASHEPVRLSHEQARRFLVLRHGLAPPRALPARPDSVLAVMERLGLLQFDPLDVTGARSHDLVLHARIDGYRREWCEQWLYGPDRRLFEIYNKSLNLVSIDELPHHRVSWDRFVERYEQGILHEHADVARNILERIDKEGPLSTSAFSEHAHSVDWWWAPTRVARAVLEALFVVGRVGIARREGNRRYYDLVERLVPGEILERHEGHEEGMVHRLYSRFRATGLTSPSANAEVILGTGSAAERQRRTATLVERGELVPVAIEDVKQLRYAPAIDTPLLERVVRDAVRIDPAVAFIAPLDPMLWDRRVLRDVWDFDYVWEVYVPEQRRRWGYYVLPILFADRLVGRFEPRYDRASRTLRILGLWWEHGFSPISADGFVDAMREALRAYAEFVGANGIEWLPPTGRAGRLFGIPKVHMRSGC
jgi:uncharacterized protein YcaQ